MPSVRCSTCSLPYPDAAFPHRCPHCGGLFDFDGPPRLDWKSLRPGQPGMWRYSSSFSLPESAPVVSLGEGSTPLIPIAIHGRQVWLKMESQNPTGSYKDRGSAVLLSRLAAGGVRQAVEDSSGNAGASFAAYATRAGVAARVFVPESASGPKRNQIEAYGAELVRVPGPRSAAAEAVLRALEDAPAGAPPVYASHAYLPFGLPGIATIAYEIHEQLAQLGLRVGTVAAPVGHGGLLLGIMRGFAALAGEDGPTAAAGPYYVGVQARECAPVWQAFHSGLGHLAESEEGVTIAEGVRVRQPARAQAILRVLSEAGGRMEAVDEADILPAYVALARLGVHVEPTSALVWAVLPRLLGKVPEPIVLILSGAGLKYNPSNAM